MVAATNATTRQSRRIHQRSQTFAPGCVTGQEALEAFLGRLAARDSSEHTRRAYRTSISQYLDWLDAQDADWQSPPRPLIRGYLGELAERGLSRRSVSSRVAALRSFYRYARREGIVSGDPWSAALTPRLPRRLPAGLCHFRG